MLHAGDTAVVAAGMERQVTAVSTARLIVCGPGDAVVRARGEEAPRGTPARIA